MIALSAWLFGYLLREAGAWQCALLMTAALRLIKPGWLTDLAGLSLAAAVVLAYLAASRYPARAAA